jgi:hypothetical protein
MLLTFGFDAQVTHGSLAACCAEHIKAHKLSRSDVAIQTISISFDPHVLQVIHAS